MVNSKEITLKALNRVRTETVPVGIFLGGVWPILHSGLTLEELIGDSEKTAKINFEVNQKLGADIIITGAGATAMMIRSLGGEVRFDGKGAPQIISPLITKETNEGVSPRIVEGNKVR
jgi:uroporphyrinogen-III decarboxylase